MKKIIAQLRGKRTFIAAGSIMAMSIAQLVLYYVSPENPHALDFFEAGTQFLEGAAFYFGRSAINKVEKRDYRTRPTDEEYERMKDEPRG